MNKLEFEVVGIQRVRVRKDKAAQINQVALLPSFINECFLEPMCHDLILPGEVDRLNARISAHPTLMLHLLVSIYNLYDLNQITEGLMHDGFEEHGIVVL